MGCNSSKDTSSQQSNIRPQQSDTQSQQSNIKTQKDTVDCEYAIKLAKQQ